MTPLLFSGRLRQMKPPLSACVLILAVILTLPVGLCRAETVKDFTLPSAMDSSVIRLSDYSGKVILLHWWRTSCGYCQRGDPKVVELEKKYRDQGLVVIGVSDDNSNTVAKIPAYLQQYGITWPVGLN